MKSHYLKSANKHMWQISMALSEVPKHTENRKFLQIQITLKAAARDLKYFASSNFFESLVHKKNFGLIWQVVFKLRYLFCKVR